MLYPMLKLLVSTVVIHRSLPEVTYIFGFVPSFSNVLKQNKRQKTKENKREKTSLNTDRQANFGVVQNFVIKKEKRKEFALVRHTFIHTETH